MRQVMDQSGKQYCHPDFFFLSCCLTYYSEQLKVNSPASIGPFKPR